ncbi:MAG: DUF2125 domain-containing protein [Paracoccaceae bacterium]
MRVLKWLAVLVLALFVAVWFGASHLLRRGAEAFLADQAAQGMVAETTALSVGGFPGWLAVETEGLRLGDPRSGTLWEAPSLQVSVPAWRPWEVTAELPASQSLTLPGQEVGLVSQGLTASVRVAPAVTAPLQEITLGGAALRATSTLGWAVGADDLRARLLVSDGDPRAYALTVTAAGIAPPEALMQALARVSLPESPAPDLPARVEAVQLDLTLHLTRPLDLNAAGAEPQLEGLELTGLTAGWGPLQIAAEGRLQADAAGMAEGRIEIRITNWDRLPPLLVASGALKPEIAPTIANMLRAMAADSGDPALLKVPLTMGEGRMSLGPLPLGPAPQFRGAAG